MLNWFKKKIPDNPINLSLSKPLPQKDSATAALALLREISRELGITATEAEIVVLLIGEGRLTKEEIVQRLSHVSPGHIGKILKNLMGLQIVTGSNFKSINSYFMEKIRDLKL